MEIASTYYKSNEIRGSYRWNSQSSPVQNVPHQNALYKALHLSSQHVQMFCHSPFPVALPPLKDHIVWRLSQEGFSEQADGHCQIIGRKPNKEKGCLKINAEWCATYITDRHHRTTRVTRVTFPVCREVTSFMRTSWCIPGASLVTARWISGRCQAVSSCPAAPTSLSPSPGDCSVYISLTNWRRLWINSDRRYDVRSTENTGPDFEGGRGGYECSAVRCRTVSDRRSPLRCTNIGARQCTCVQCLWEGEMRWVKDG